MELSSAPAGGIPRVIHQVWWQGADQIPDRLLGAYEKTQRQARAYGYKYIFWDEASFLALADRMVADAPTEGLRDLCKWMRWAIGPDSELRIIEKCDLARTLPLYVIGGLYLDLDYEMKRPPDAVLDDLRPGAAAVGRMAGALNNGWIASPRRADFWTAFFWPDVRRNYHDLIETPSMLGEVGDKIFRTLNFAGPGPYLKYFESSPDARLLDVRSFHEIYVHYGVHEGDHAWIKDFPVFEWISRAPGVAQILDGLDVKNDVSATFETAGGRMVGQWSPWVHTGAAVAVGVGGAISCEVVAAIAVFFACKALEAKFKMSAGYDSFSVNLWTDFMWFVAGTALGLWIKSTWL